MPNTRPLPEPAHRHLPSWLLLIGTTLVLLGVDLTTKSLAFRYVAQRPVALNRETATQPGTIPSHEPRLVVPYMLSLQLTLNTGAVFGLGKGGREIFIVCSILATAVILRCFWTSSARARGMHLALALVLAGAMGNLYDRVRFHAVRDLLLLFPNVRLPFGWHWAGGSDELYPWIFNVADASLLIGVLLAIRFMWRQQQLAPDGETVHD